MLSAIDPKYLDSIADIIRDESSVTKYTDAKTQLLALLKESEGKQLKTLLHGMELGQQKPSFLLQKMQSLAGGNVSEKLIRQLWLEKLPESVRNVVVVSDEKLSKLAEMADKIVDLSPIVEVYSAASAASKQPALEILLPQLIHKMDQMEKQISALTLENRSRHRSPSYDNRNRNRSRSRKRFNPDGKLCYYHFTFGSKANKCTAPCGWETKDNQENCKRQ